MEVWLVRFMGLGSFTYDTEVFSSIENAWQYIENWYRSNNFLEIEEYREIQHSYEYCKAADDSRFFNNVITAVRKKVK